MTKLRSITIIGTCAILLTGCALFKKAYVAEPVYHPAVPASTNTTEVISVVTNAAGVPVSFTNVINVVTPPKSEYWVTNYSPNPSVISGVNQVGQTIGAAGVPWTGVVTSLLLALYGAGATILNATNKKKATLIANTLVDNIESARSILKAVPTVGPQLDQQLVAKITDTQQAAGVRTDIHSLVVNK